MDALKQHIEALIFASPQAVSVAELQASLCEALQREIPAEHIRQMVAELQARYQGSTYAFELVEIAGGFQFMTKSAYYPTVAVHLRQTNRRRLSQAALETLAIIAYKQPITRSEIEAIRGVNCEYALQKLLEKELVIPQGRSEGPGRPLLYGTSEKFMDYLGIRSLGDLPTPKDLKEMENTVGRASDGEEPIITSPQYS
jgi:segregation and condensation protein B